MRHAATILLVPMLLLAMAPAAQAQDDDDGAGTLSISYFKCDFGDMGQIADETDSLVVPIYRELVNEGTLLGMGMLGHDWAGYENILYWTYGASKAKVFEAQAEFSRRFGERHPDAELTQCNMHRDGLYTMGPNTGPAPRKPGNTIVSYFKCDYSTIGDIQSATDSLALPIWKELVEAGHWDAAGLAFHDWAGYENVLFWRHAKDKSSFFAGADRFAELMEERHPDLEAGEGPMQGCNMHRDQIYWWGPSSQEWEESEGDM